MAMDTRLDLAAYNRNDELVLIIEVKTKLGTSSKWAAQLRRNIFAHGILPPVKFFLLAFPDRFYLWENNHNDLSEIEPDYIVDAQPILAPYFKQAKVRPDQISGESFELVVASWLSELVHSDKLSEKNDPAGNWLIESGLHKALTGGRLAYEVAV